MFILAIDPLTKNELGKFTIDTKNLYKIYEILMMALDTNPQSETFAKKMQEMIQYIDDPVLFQQWLTAVQKITTEVERADVMCFTLEDYIDEWYVADFIDARFLIIKLVYDSNGSLTTTETPTFSLDHLNTTSGEPEKSVDNGGSNKLDNSLEMSFVSNATLVN